MIAVIGAGVMGETFIAALLDSGLAPSDVLISENRAERASEVSLKYAVMSGSAADVAAQADVVIIAVKPQQMPEVLAEIGPVVRDGATVISLAAGISLDVMQKACGLEVACVRAMSNTPALVGQGMTVISRGGFVDEVRMNAVRTLLSSVGTVAEVDEAYQDAVTAISGSGPAYVFAMMEALEAAAIELGLESSIARTLVVNTVVGAGVLAQQTGVDPAELRRRVTSPGGTTAAALEVFADRDLTGVVRAATHAARDRSVELGSASPPSERSSR